MLKRITDFVQHLQREDHFNNDLHQTNLVDLEREFHANNEGPARNAFLSVRPRKFYERCSSYLWMPGKWQQNLLEQVEEEAEELRARFEADVQLIFSHVQHHWHPLNAKGKREPCLIADRRLGSASVASTTTQERFCVTRLGKYVKIAAESALCAKALQRNWTSK